MHTTPLVLGWAVWQPFNTDHTTQDESLLSGRQVSMDLVAGPCFQPGIIPYSAHNACYKVCIGMYVI